MAEYVSVLLSQWCFSLCCSLHSVSVVSTVHCVPDAAALNTPPSFLLNFLLSLSQV